MGEKRNCSLSERATSLVVLKGLKTLSVDYTANKNAWMTQEIFNG